MCVGRGKKKKERTNERERERSLTSSYRSSSVCVCSDLIHLPPVPTSSPVIQSVNCIVRAPISQAHVAQQAQCGVSLLVFYPSRLSRRATFYTPPPQNFSNPSFNVTTSCACHLCVCVCVFCTSREITSMSAV